MLHSISARWHRHILNTHAPMVDAALNSLICQVVCVRGAVADSRIRLGGLVWGRNEDGSLGTALRASIYIKQRQDVSRCGAVWPTVTRPDIDDRQEPPAYTLMRPKAETRRSIQERTDNLPRCSNTLSCSPLKCVQHRCRYGDSSSILVTSDKLGRSALSDLHDYAALSLEIKQSLNISSGALFVFFYLLLEHSW
jgi:hypothetical protein